MSELFTSDTADSTPDHGASLASELSTTSSVPTATPDAATVQPSTPDLDAAGHGSAAAPTLPSTQTETPAAQPRTEAGQFAPADPIAQARQSLESDPVYAPIFELRNRFTDGDFQEVIPRLERLARDPIAFYNDLGEELKRNGMLPSGEQQGAFELLEPDLSNEDGSQQAYSAGAVAKMLQQLRAEMTGHIQPILTERQEAERVQKENEEFQSRLKVAQSEVRKAAASLPNFTELVPEIKQLLAADREKPAHMREFNDNIYAAYFRASQSNQTTLEERARQTVVADLKKKSEASTTQPRARVSGGGESRPPRNFAEASERSPNAALAALASLGG